MMRKQSVMVLGSVLVACAPLSAAVSYQYVADRSSYDLSQGQSTVWVYLQETCSDGSTSQIDGAAGGLNGASFAVHRDSGTSAGLAGLAFNPAFNAGAPFNSASLAADGSSGFLGEAISMGASGVGFETQHPDWVLLGTLNLEVNQGGGATRFTIADPVPQSPGDISNNQGYSLDQVAPTSAVFTVVVPEPSSIGLVLAVASGMLVPRKRR